jgi:ribosomal protein L31E
MRGRTAKRLRRLCNDLYEDNGLSFLTRSYEIEQHPRLRTPWRVRMRGVRVAQKLAKRLWKRGSQSTETAVRCWHISRFLQEKLDGQVQQRQGEQS